MKKTLLIAVFCIMACDPAVPVTPEPAYYPGNDGSSSSSGGACCDVTTDHSGDRLRRYVFKGPDGLYAYRPNRFFDAELQVDCAPGLTPKGLRCVPFYEVAVTHTNVFTDAACVAPGAHVSNKCIPPKYAHSATSAGCGAAAESVIVELDTVNVLPVAYKLVNEKCQPFAAAELADKSVYAVIGEANYEMFAPVELAAEGP